jgi:hypothetical protein
MSVEPVVPEAFPLNWLTGVTAVAGAVASGAVIVFYATELHQPEPRVFGPISDIATVAWCSLFVVLAVALGRPYLTSRLARLLLWLTVAISVAGAFGTLLLVVRVLPFEVATPISVLGVLIQAAWLYTVCQGAERSNALTRRLTGYGKLMGAGTGAGTVLCAVSIPFGWLSMPQLVIMVLGLIPGLFGWLSWPIWLTLVTRHLSHSTPHGPVGDRHSKMSIPAT